MHQLKLGDVVTFGHPFGYSVKPGEKSEQPPSEFSFVVRTVHKRFPFINAHFYRSFNVDVVLV